MSKHYAAPEEILYHVGFSAQQLQGATVAVLPGDPGRVEPLAKALGSDASFIASHREYTSWLTKISDTPVLVCSTGMGSFRSNLSGRAGAYGHQKAHPLRYDGNDTGKG